MTWTLLICLSVALVLALAVAFHRRLDLRRQQAVLRERAVASGRSNEAGPLQLPVIDLSRCLGCGTCVRSCPEDGVLDLVHGQAAVVNAAACVGHARCVAECPVGAVTLTSGDLSARKDVPVLDAELQAVGTDGLYLVGEITAKALIRSAAEQGVRVARTIAQRCAERAPLAAATAGGGGEQDDVLDLVIVGAGPGGLACALGAVEQGLAFELLDQEEAIGGTVAKYPRRKLVLTEPIELPLLGRMRQREYAKEDLIELWQEIADRHQLPFRGGVTFDRCERQPDGTFRVDTDQGAVLAHNVVLAVGRRGQPRRLDVPGEELPHVAYSLLDAGSFTDCRVVVIGGGDSAVEAAMALAEQPGNEVTIVYRQDDFFRIRRKNKDKLQARRDDGRIRCLFRQDIAAITATAVDLVSNDGTDRRTRLTADQVFVLVGGVPPFAQLEQCGVSFDQTRRPAAVDGATEPASNAAAGSLLPVLAGTTVLTLATFAFAALHADYYSAPAALRAADPKHALLRPDQSLGLWFGVAAVIALVANLAYLLRRRLTVRFGSLTGWMNAHIVTGVAAVLLAALHAAMAPRPTPGGQAFWALVALVGTGAIGRWFYAWLPRAANGRELTLAAVRADLARLRAASDGEFAAMAQHETEALLERRQWRSTFLGRALALLGLQWDLWRTVRRLEQQARAERIAPLERRRVLAGVRKAYGIAVAAAHLEDLRAVLSTWRWLHRWLALLLVLLIVVHVVMAWLHGAFASGATFSVGGPR
ncbi:MAG: NAD(P)-binding domain-containing protein [Planctomycetes bacterium]|nr:NAD(P)-binding domain-containing protein [Planctomycetota bacterium]